MYFKCFIVFIFNATYVTTLGSNEWGYSVFHLKCSRAVRSGTILWRGGVKLNIDVRVNDFKRSKDSSKK